MTTLDPILRTPRGPGFRPSCSWGYVLEGIHACLMPGGIFLWHVSLHFLAFSGHFGMGFVILKLRCLSTFSWLCQKWSRPCKYYLLELLFLTLRSLAMVKIPLYTSFSACSVLRYHDDPWCVRLSQSRSICRGLGGRAKSGETTGIHSILCLPGCAFAKNV